MILLSACNKEYRQIQKSRDTDVKYAYAMRMFEEGRYSRALSMFEDIQNFMRGRENFETMTYTMAYAYYRSGDFFMAAHVFQNYTRLYPNSEKTEECFFMAAYCMMLDVPYYKLDQTNAYNAIKQFQLFINYYPESSKVKESNEFIDVLRLQLARKAFELANNYFRRQLYISASISFKNVIKDFSETKYREEAMFMNVRALYYYAHHSIREKQVERYQNTIEAYEQLERAYPESQYLSKLKNYIAAANNFLDKQKRS
jgi:outer membrane protein assembly factor BamD